MVAKKKILPFPEVSAPLVERVAACFGVSFPWDFAAHMVRGMGGACGWPCFLKAGGLKAREGRGIEELVSLRLPGLVFMEGGDVPFARLPSGYWYDVNGVLPVIPQGRVARVVLVEGVLGNALQDFRKPSVAWFWDSFAGLKGPLARVALIGLVVQIAGLMVPLFSMAVYDRVVPTGAMQTLWLLSLGIFLVLALDMVLRALKTRMLAAVLSRVAMQQDEALLALLLRQRVSMAVSSSQLDLLRLTRDMREQLVMHILPNLADVPFVLLFLAAITFLAPSLLPVPLSLIAITFCLQLWIFPSMAKAATRDSVAVAKRGLVLYDLVRSALLLRLFNRQYEAQNRWRSLADEFHTAEAAAQLWQALGQHITITIAQLSYVLVVMAGAVDVVAGHLTVGVLIAVSMLCSRAITPALQLVDTLSRFQKVRAGFSQLARGLEPPLEALHVTPDSPQVIARPLGEIQLQGVTVAGGKGLSRPILTGINILIQPGERWALVGVNGAGKSSLLHVLSGFLVPTEGRVLLDHVAYDQMPVAEVRRHIAFVPQTPVFADVALRETLVGMEPVDEPRLAEALEISGFAKVMAERGMGLEFRPGPQAELLSGGQRQMLALAAALYRNPSVLMLDEPTSSLDPDSEAAFCSKLKAWLVAHRVTLLLVTHRVGMLDLVDNMAVMASGTMLFGGPKKDVLKRLKGEPHGL